MTPARLYYTVQHAAQPSLADDDVTGSPRSDAELVADALGGDKNAYGDLVRRYAKAARAACFAVLKDWHLAEDAAQDGFISAYSHLRSLRKADYFGTWLLTIMRNRAVRQANTRRTHLTLESETEPAIVEPVPPDTQRLIEAIDRLPRHERVVVMLRYFENYDVGAIARFCGRPVGTVTKQLSRAHQRLQKLLKD